MARKLTATILFVDIMDSMEMANYWGTMQYCDFLNEFQETMQRGICLWKEGIKQIKLAGDELAVFYSSNDVTEDATNAIQLANTLKILWYISSTNRTRIKEGKKILDLGVGINTGDVTYERRPVAKELRNLVHRRKTFEGLPISLAKRIENFSREGRFSRIMVGHRTMAELNRFYHHYECQCMGLQRLKGMSQEIPIFELKSCYTLDAEVLAGYKDFDWAIKQLERIRVFDPSNIWLLMTLIDIYRNREKHKKVEQLCREAIAIDRTVADIHHELGVALHEQKKYEDALQHFDDAINLRWDDWSAYIGKAVCLVNLGAWDKCVETCMYAIRNVPPWLKAVFLDDLHFYMAAAYARKDNVRKALANLKKAIHFGGTETLKKLKKDEGENFSSLYDDAEFKRLLARKKRKKNSKSSV